MIGIATATQKPASATLCATVQKLARMTWKYIEDGEGSGLRISEESITEVNLLHLWRKHSQHVFTTKYSRRIEGTSTGADWEWWLTNVGQTKWLGLRVQAKRILDDKYAHINHFSRGQYQIDRLIGSASTTTAGDSRRREPVYIFYNYFASVQFPLRQISALSLPCCLAEYDILNTDVKLWGCTIASAHALKKIGPKSRANARSILRRSVPLHCLFCRSNSVGRQPALSDLVDRVADTLGVLSGDPDPGDPDLRVAVYRDPPNYVLAMIRPGIPVRPPSGLNCVVVTIEPQDQG